MCNCIEVVNRRLALVGTRLAEITVIRDGGGFRSSLVVKTESAQPGRRRMKPPTVLPSYCPFCGEHIPPVRGKDRGRQWTDAGAEPS